MKSISFTAALLIAWASPLFASDSRGKIDARHPPVANMIVANTINELAQLNETPGRQGDEFGLTIAVCGQTIVVGASELNSSTIGAAYVFVEGALGWKNMTQTAKLTASDGASGAVFGSSVACSGNTVVVGAPHQPVGGKASQGEAYVFVKPASGWHDMTETARLTSPDGAASDDFGYSVSIVGKIIAVGAPQASGQVQFEGKAYIFEKPALGGWKTTSNASAIVTASNAQFDRGFGASVSLGSAVVSGDTLAVGAPNGGPSGAVYVFVEPQGGWTTTSHFNAELTASDGQPGDALGYSVSINKNTVAAGAYQVNAAYMFVEPLGGWANGTETAKLTAPPAVVGSYFGYSLSLTSNKLVVGSANDPSESSAFVYFKPTTGWATTSKYYQRLTSSDGYGFGFSVAAGGGVIAVGSIGVDNLQGTAYVYGK